MNKIRVVVFGSTGSGKTSLCNALTGGKRPTDSGARGVTTKTHIYPPFYEGDNRIEVVDTAGLHESEHGTVPPEEAVIQIVQLLESARDGFSLLIHVARAGRVTQHHDEDYQFFVEKMAQGNIPAILILTGCEDDEPMSAWVEKNRDAFRRFRYRELIATCFKQGGKKENDYAPLRVQSRELVIRSVLAHALANPARIYGPGTGSTIDQTLTRLWNEFVTLVRLPDEYRRKINESAWVFLKRLGVPQKIADAAIKHIPDLFEELGRKAPVPFLGKFLKWVSRSGLGKIFKNRKPQ